MATVSDYRCMVFSSAPVGRLRLLYLSYSREREEFVTIIRRYELEMTKLQSDMTNIKNEKLELECALADLRAVFDRANLHAQESRDSMVAQYESEISSLRQQLREYASLNAKNSEMSQRLAAVELDRQESHALIRKLDGDLDILRGGLDEKADQFRLLQQANISLKKESQELHEINSDLRRQIENLHTSSGEKERQIWNLHRQLGDSIEKSSLLQENLGVAHEELKMLSKDMNIAAKEIQALNRDLASAIEESDTHRFEKETFKSQLSHVEETLKSKDHELQGIYASYRSLVAEHDQLKSNIQGKDQELIELQ
jgi:regulator of replication initiation timing